MARARRRRRMRFTAVVAIGVAAAVFFLWPESRSNWTGDGSPREQTPGGGESAAVSHVPRADPGEASAPIDGRGARTGVEGGAPSAHQVLSPQRVARAMDHKAKGEAAEAGGELLVARDHYTMALKLGLPVPEERQVRQRLLELAQETILSPRRVSGDPLTATHTVAAGESLERIARRYKVSAQFLARINGIDNPNFIRQGQRLKVVHGPFRAVVEKRKFRLSTYLGDVLVGEYPVGLGADDSTPSGRWRVKDGHKLPNPTYHPPPSVGGPIIHADDPENPLGEHWIGLEGVSGEAVGQKSYGIHGTIEPETIGNNASAGCIRMHNEDVAEVFAMLIEVESEVLVRP